MNNKTTTKVGYVKNYANLQKGSSYHTTRHPTILSFLLLLYLGSPALYCELQIILAILSLVERGCKTMKFFHVHRISVDEIHKKGDKVDAENNHNHNHNHNPFI